MALSNVTELSCSVNTESQIQSSCLRVIYLFALEKNKSETVSIGLLLFF